MGSDLSGASTYSLNLWSKFKGVLRFVIMRTFWASVGWLLKYVNRRSQIEVTCSRSDGAGAQLQARYSVKTFATVFGFRYLESPIRALLPDNNATKIMRWNQIIEPFDEITGEIVKVSGPIDLCRELLFRRTEKKRVIEFQQCHFYTDYFPSSLSIHRENFKARVSRAISLWGLDHRENPERCVIHLRRGLMHYDSDRRRITSNEELFQHLEILRHAFPKERVRIFNYVKDDSLINSLPAWVSMDYLSDEFEVFAHCAQADVFLMAKSSFSYIAALANPNKVLYQEFWHPPISGWQKV